jgi:branched-chain amino acid aminotransferase
MLCHSTTIAFTHLRHIIYWLSLIAKVQEDPYIKVHIGATALHYGQACFEGLKAFHCKDGKVKIFRPTENAKRIAKSCQRICMPEVTEELFLKAVRTAVKQNLAFLPPFGTGGALVSIDR